MTSGETVGPGGRTVAFLSIVLTLLLAGLSLRFFRLHELPAGPWIDEAYALRAAREATASGWAGIPASLPLQPPGAPFVNFWLTGPYLAFASALDRAAGGGIASFRLLSTLPAVLVLGAGILVAWEALRPRRGPLLLATFLLASSSWLLSTSRWGWVANFSAALVVLSAALALRAVRAASRSFAALQAAAAGACLGAAQYGYPSAWLVAPLPFAVLAWAAFGSRSSGPRRPRVEAAAAAVAAFVAVAAPLAIHYASHPERAAARPAELSIAPGGAASAVRSFAANARGYSRLFLVGGDPNERHGSPDRPVLPAAVSGLAAIGLVSAIRLPRLRLLSAGAVLLILGGLLARGEGPNGFRISAAAPFLVVLAVSGGVSVADRLPRAARRTGCALLAATLAIGGTLDAAAFLEWLSSPRLRGAFGGPERELADAIRSEVATGQASAVILDPRAARNPWVVDVLLASPAGGGRRVLAWASVSDESLDRVAAARPGRAALVAAPRTEEALDAIARRGGRVVAESTPLEGFPGWLLFRLGPFSERPPRGDPPGPPSAPR